MSVKAQEHAHKRHGDDFLKCLPYLEDTVTTPSQLGQSPKHLDGFELIKEINEAGFFVLVAMLILPSRKGIYQVTSAYPIGLGKVEGRLKTGHIIHV